ncbi:pro-sigmaK processing inhibitor BofA family protein [Ectobacillus funiculus]|uniref:pro-sigmaK processing inhibitor BofA family protein n=1 Tax=Ectobacillus funiculus TaxID=137993 RepID=UPI00397D85D7
MMDHIAVIAIVAGIIMLLMLAGAPLKPFRFIGMSIIRVLVGALLLFILNVIGAQLNLHIPINLITASVCGFLGIPGLGALAVIQMYILS